MTLDEAQKVAAIVSTADNGCPARISALVRLCNNSFPEFIWATNDDAEYQSGYVTVRER